MTAAGPMMGRQRRQLPCAARVTAVVTILAIACSCCLFSHVQGAPQEGEVELSVSYEQFVTVDESITVSVPDGGNTTQLVLKLTAEFGVDVRDVAITDFEVTNATVADLVQESASLYHMTLTLPGNTVGILIVVRPFASAIFPPVEFESRFSFEYAPSMSARFDPAVQVNSDTTPPTLWTSEQAVTMIATFQTPVSGVAGSDFKLSGCSGENFVAISSTEYSLDLTMALVGEVRVEVPPKSGNIYPPNAPLVFLVEYRPSVALSCSDGITDGAKSSLIHVTLTATFGSPVTGMQASDFAVVGASIVDGTFAALSGATYEVELELGAAGDVTSTIPQLSGSIEPPNAGSPSFLVRYRPTVTFELSDGLQPGGTTTLLELTLTMHVATPVTGVEVGDLLMRGSDFVPEQFRRVTASLYTLPLYPGILHETEIAIVGESGNIDPPNAAAQIKFLFDTIVTLSMDAGITHGSTTSLRLATLTSEFIVDVLFFERRDYVFEGCELLKDFKLSQRLYTARMTWGAEEHVVMSIPAHQGAIFPPNAASNIFRFTFAPAVALSLSSGVEHGQVTTDHNVTLTVQTNADVTNLTLADFDIVGAVAQQLVRVQGDHYEIPMLFGLENGVSLSLPARAGSVYPPNAASPPFEFTYRPQPLFSLSDGLAHGGITWLRSITLTTTFNTDVAGFQEADLLILNATKVAFVQTSPRVYTLGLALQEGGDMRADIALASGVVFPQNAPAPQLQLTYAPRTDFILDGGEVALAATTSRMELMVTATFGSWVRNVKLDDFKLAGCYGSDSFQRVSEEEYHFRIFYGATDGVSVSLPRFIGTIYPPPFGASVRIVYAPAVHFTMSDGIEYGDISSLQLVTATAHFDTPMRWVDDEGADFSTEGAVITGWALLDDSTYDLVLRMGHQAHVSIWINARAGIVFPPNAASIPFNITYAPSVVITFGHGLESGDVTSLKVVETFAEFGDPVDGVNASDFVIDGGRIADLVKLSPTLYQFNSYFGPSQHPVIFLPARAGAITPANARSANVTLLYKPAVILTFSDRLVTGDATGFTNFSVIANFGTDVSGVAASDFTVIGGLKDGMYPISKSKYALRLQVGNWSRIHVRYLADRGNVFPQNAAADDVFLDYIFPTTTRRYMIQMKFRVLMDFGDAPLDSPLYGNLTQDLLQDLSDILDIHEGRFEVVSYTSHRGRVFVVIGIFPVKEKSYALTEEQLHIQKSPTALGNEVVAYLDRVGRGTFSMPGKILPFVDPLFVQVATFKPCEIGIFVFQEECPPVPRPCGNGTLLSPCPRYVKAYGIVIPIMLVVVVAVFTGLVLVSRRFFMRETEVLNSVGMAASVAVNITDVSLIFVWWSHGMFPQMILSGLAYGAMAVFNLIVELFHYNLFGSRRSRLYDPRFKAFMSAHPKFMRLVMVMGLGNVVALKMPFMKWFNLDWFTMMPLTGADWILNTLKPVTILEALADAGFHLYLVCWTLDEWMEDFVDAYMYWVASVYVVSIAIHLYMCIKDSYRATRASLSLAHKAVTKVTVSGPNLDRDIPYPLDSPPSSPRPHLMTLSFKSGKLGLKLAEVRGGSKFKAIVRDPPTGQAAQGNLIRVGDSVYRINGTPVYGCGFADIVRLLYAVPRPFTVDFARPYKEIDVAGHSTVTNVIADDVAVAPQGALSPLRNLGHAAGIGAGTVADDGRRIVPTRSLKELHPKTPRENKKGLLVGMPTKRSRRVPLPPLARVKLDAKQQQWGIPVYPPPADYDPNAVYEPGDGLGDLVDRQVDSSGSDTDSDGAMGIVADHGSLPSGLASRAGSRPGSRKASRPGSDLKYRVPGPERRSTSGSLRIGGSARRLTQQEEQAMEPSALSAALVAAKKQQRPASAVSAQGFESADVAAEAALRANFPKKGSRLRIGGGAVPPPGWSFHESAAGSVGGASAASLRNIGMMVDSDDSGSDGGEPAISPTEARARKQRAMSKRRMADLRRTMASRRAANVATHHLGGSWASRKELAAKHTRAGGLRGTNGDGTSSPDAASSTPKGAPRNQLQPTLPQSPHTPDESPSGKQHRKARRQRSQRRLSDL